MTNTDALRKMLDELGVKHFDGTETTAWCDNGREWYQYYASENMDGTLHLHMQHLTPNQAVEATLGRGTCKMVADNHHRVDKVTTSWGCVCSACGSFHEFTHGEGWAFCPSCRRKAADE